MTAILQFPQPEHRIRDQLARFMARFAKAKARPKLHPIAVAAYVERALRGYDDCHIKRAIRHAHNVMHTDPNADPVATAVIWAAARVCPTPPDVA